MSRILSSNGYIGVGKQAAFGAPVAPTAGLFIKYLSETLQNVQEEIKGTEGGNDRYLIENYKTTHKVAGDIVCYARPDILGFFLAMFYGADTYAAAVPGVTPAKHTFTVASPWPFTVERGIDPATPTLIERFQDCYVNALSIEGASSQPLKLTASIMGTKGVKQAAATAVTLEANQPLMYFNGAVYTLDGGAVTANISKFKIDIKQNIDWWFGATITPSEILNKLLTVDLNFTLKFENAAQYAKVYYGAGLDIVNVFADGSFKLHNEYGLLDAKRSLEMEVKHVKHLTAPVQISGEANPIYQECVAYGVKVGADALVSAIVENTFAADYDV